MNMYDIIVKKQRGFELTEEEIRFFIKGSLSGSVPDYQTSALLMAIWFRGMTDSETYTLTREMEHSGETVDLSEIAGLKADKHSTGGVGDKTTLAVAPIVAACGIKVAKMSGRGLGHTGGTLDKLESIPGFNTAQKEEDFIRIVNDIGLCVIGQSGNLVPADKKLYGLRDVTATVDSLSLIASSIMSKKLASGADLILLDVKFGSGAFMHDVESAVKLAELMVHIGNSAGKRTTAVLTNMDIPLGWAVGNSLEVIEAAETLLGRENGDFKAVTLALAADILFTAGKGNMDECFNMAENAIENGSAFDKLCAMVKAEGGDAGYIKDTGLFPKADYIVPVKSEREGYIERMETAEIGRVSVTLGAGRNTVNASVDHSAGIRLCRKTGDYIKKGETIAWLHTNNADAVDESAKRYLAALSFSAEPPELKPLIYAYVNQGGVHLCSDL